MDTKQLIKNCFVDLYLKYDYNKITIKSICENVPLARSTFYFHFQNIAEVKETVEDEAIKGIRSSCENIYSEDFEKQFSHAMDYMNSNKVFYVFLVKQPNAVFIEKFKNEIIWHFEENFSINKNSKNYNLELELFASTIVSYYTYYLKHPQEIDLKNVSQKFEQIKNLIQTYL